MVRVSDIRSPELFMAGRWKWTGFGYELGFKGSCAFADIDAITEFNNRVLVIEGKAWNGEGLFPAVPVGQIRLLERLAKMGCQVFIVFGSARDNNPLGLRDVNSGASYDWRLKTMVERRLALKAAIDEAMNVTLSPALSGIFIERFASTS